MIRDPRRGVNPLRSPGEDPGRPGTIGVQFHLRSWDASPAAFPGFGTLASPRVRVRGLPEQRQCTGSRVPGPGTVPPGAQLAPLAVPRVSGVWRRRRGVGGRPG